MRKPFSIALAGCAMLGFICPPALPQNTQVRTTLDGAYTEAQANRGQAVFEGICEGCHQQPNLSNADAAPLRGNRFLDRWRDDSLTNLFTTMKTTMPRAAGGNPNDRGSTKRLSDTEYLDILTFILRANDFPAGAEELSIDKLDSTELVGKDGPRPLPDFSTVRVIGCLSSGASNVWMLTNATPPRRTITPEQSTQEELKTAQAQGLRTETFRLQSFEYAPSSINPALFKEHKVLVKGVLRRQASPPDRINVLSMESVAAVCRE